MLTHINHGSPFFMYPKFIQLLLDKQLEDVPKPQHFLPTVVLPPKVFTFMSNKGVKFSRKNTPLTAHILEVAQAVRDAASDLHILNILSQHIFHQHLLHHLSKMFQVK